MRYSEKVGLLKKLLPGMFVRVPIEVQRSDRYYREYRIGKIESINEAANTAILTLFNYSPGEKPKEESLECSLRGIMRCRVLPETQAYFAKTGAAAKILIDRESTWVDGKYKQYYVEVEEGILCISEAELKIPSHRQCPHPFQQLQSYELQNPVWRGLRDKVVSCISELKNATYGLEDLVGSRVMLLAHQAEVIARVLGDPKCRYILADEVGLGKTIEACAIIKGLRRRIPDLKTLIVVPDSLTVQWKNELDQKFWMSFPILSGRDKIPINIPNPGCIVSVEDLEASDAVSHALYGEQWDLLIVDEAHHVSKSEVLFERVKLLSSQAHRSLILSATPIQRRAEEFLGLLKLMDPESYENINVSSFEATLKVQDKIRRRIAFLTRLLTAEDFDVIDFLDEIQPVSDILRADHTLVGLVEILKTQTVNPGQFQKTAQYIIAYISENYRIENRVIRNRRANLSVELPTRQVDQSFSYSIGQEENAALQSLYDYIDYLSRSSSTDRLALEYFRLLLFSAASSPHALFSLLDQRRQHLVSFGNDYEPYVGEITRPGAPRQEAFRINRIVRSLSAGKDEQTLLESLTWHVNTWKDKYNQQLQAGYSYHTPPSSDTSNRLLQVIRALYKLTNQKDVKVVIFSAWSETLEALQKALETNFGKWMVARFSCDMDTKALEKEADRFQSEDDCQILLSDELGGEGRNFQIADYVIHVDIPWTPTTLEQRIGRVDRLGRKGKVISIVPYAKGTIEEDLFSIWQDSLNLFTQSMSGMEIALEGIQDELSEAIAQSVRNGLTSIKKSMLERAIELRRIVEEERYFEQGAINHRRRDEIQTTSRKYWDGKVVQDPFLAWADVAGLKYDFTSKKDILFFDPREFNFTSMNNARFVEPPNMEEALKRSRRQHNKVITGTFNRDVAIREEDLVFFAPGNDPWTDAILKNSLESDRGRCCGIGRAVASIDRSLELFDLLFSILVNPRPLYRHGSNSTHLFRAQGYLQKPCYRILVTKEGDVLPSSHPAWGVIKAPYSKIQDFHLGKREGSKAKIQEFIARYNPQDWSDVLKRVFSAAEEKLKEEFEFTQELAEEAREEFQHQADGQRAAKQFLYKGQAAQLHLSEVDEFEEISEALVEGIADPIWELESVCFWLLEGKTLNE